MNQKKLDRILVVKVDNGYIVEENYSKGPNMGEFLPEVPNRKVFETKESMFHYISENL